MAQPLPMDLWCERGVASVCDASRFLGSLLIQARPPTLEDYPGLERAPWPWEGALCAAGEREHDRLVLWEAEGTVSLRAGGAEGRPARQSSGHGRASLPWENTFHSRKLLPSLL